MRVEVPCYIKDALVHLSNTKTYQIISEEQGKRDIIDLKWEIFAWTIDHRRVLSKTVVAYIRKKLEISMEDLFGYFYLLYKLHKDPISTRPV